VGVGLYTYDWTCPAAQAVDTYEVVWYGTADSDSHPFSNVTSLDVVTAPTAYLCTLADVRAMVHVDEPTYATDDTALQAYMADATDLIHTLTGRYFLPDDAATYVFDGQWDDPYCLRIPRGIRTITTLKVRTGGTGSAQVTLGATHYDIRPLVQHRSPGEPGNRIELNELAGYNFALIGAGVIEVIGDFGYAAVPPVIARICRETVVRAWRRRGSGFGELGAPETGAGYINWCMSLEDKRLLASMYDDGPRVA